MTEPRIQYAKTSDGVNIAYFALGRGPPLVSFTLPVSHLMVEQGQPHSCAFFELASRSWTFVRFNSRGFGLSERHVSDFSLSTMTSDIEAVANALQLETFALLAANGAAPIAIAYTAHNPQRVRRLILSEGSGGDVLPWFRGGALEDLVPLADANWRLVSEAIIGEMADWGQDAMAHEVAKHLRLAVSGRTYAEFCRQARDWSVADLLRQVDVPTLLIDSRADAERNSSLRNRLAANLSDVRLEVVDDQSRDEFRRARIAAILNFLGEDRGVTAIRPSDVALMELECMQAPATILFADIVDSTALSRRIGDVQFRGKARELDRILRRIILGCEGRTVEGKLLGDGVLAIFTSVPQAIEAGLACGQAGGQGGLPLHIGIHAGDVIHEDSGNVYGSAVNVASRISDLSGPGQVLVSQAARDLFQAIPRVAFRDRGAHRLKGIEDPVRVYEARWR